MTTLRKPRKLPKKGIHFKLKLEMHNVTPDKVHSITELGGYELVGTLTPHMAQIMADAATYEGPGKLHPLEEVIMDLTDGVKRWEDIKTETGLEDDRCKHLYDLITRIRNTFVP